ncbi:MAG TPA: D-erythronate dehydrogenase [Casimicrobiaceae bacterium]|nr:D-erythronate dehydrogenase [Casimicrobiaceae bacterium]HXU66378.1 D-erythronate dehydrogenase [Casimicrobiaceae bacterium]
MTVVITGAAGFLGQRLARKLLQCGTLATSDGRQAPIERLVLLDVVRATDFGDPRVRVIAADLTDPSVVRDAIDADVTSVFHLAAVVSGQAEADFDLGMRVNLDASRLVLEACRASGRTPRVLFTSSVAVYGGELPARVDDTTPLTPQSSYGMQKAVGELLLSDYTRKGFIDGRVARLPTISVRPGKPNQATSSFASGIIREPLNGEIAVCPVGTELRLWLLSPRRAIENLIGVHELPSDALRANRNVNLPGVSVSVARMIDALRVVGGEEAVGRIRFERNPVIERIVGSWPAGWDVSRATSLGLRGDASFEAIVRAYVEDDLKPARSN